MLSAAHGGEECQGAELPMWASVFGILALSAPPRVTLFLIGGFGVMAIALMLPPFARRVQRALGTTTAASIIEADDATDLLRLDDDGG